MNGSENITSSKDHKDSYSEIVQLLEENLRLKQENQNQQVIIDALKANEDRQWFYSLLVENSLTGIFIVQDEKIVFCNQRFAEMYGYDRDELIGKNSLDLIPLQDKKTVAVLREQRIKGEKNLPSEYEIRGLRKDEKIIWTIRRNTIVDYNGKPAILGNSIEISERKHMESRLRKSEKILRFLSTQLLQAHENERKRIARELHDTIAQNLAGIKIYLSHKMEPSQSMQVISQQLLQPVVEMAERSIKEVRRIITDLRPPCIDDLGILVTINWHCRQFNKKNSGISVIQQLELDEKDIPDSLKVVIYRVLQESLNNVAKHSGANKVFLLIKKENNVLKFLLEDNGSGFNIKDAFSPKQPEKGWGIIGMKERTELSGGVFSIESSPDKGTKILISWEC